MDFGGEHLVLAPRTRVWRALNDPVSLAGCLPGCERFEATGENAFAATVAVRVGSLAARFSGTLVVSDIVDGRSCTLTGRGQGGVAGFAGGSARVSLEDAADGTLLRYAIAAEIGGKLASVGGRLIGAFAAATADRFFARMVRLLAESESQT